MSKTPNATASGRGERLRGALRANLARRKASKRAKAEGQAREPAPKPQPAKANKATQETDANG